MTDTVVVSDDDDGGNDTEPLQVEAGAASEPGEIDVALDEDNSDRGNGSHEPPGLATMRSLLGDDLDEARARRLLTQYNGQADGALNVRGEGDGESGQ